MLEKRINIATILVFLLLILLFLSTKTWAVPEIYPLQSRTEGKAGMSLNSSPQEATASPSLAVFTTSTPSYAPPKAKLKEVLKEIEKDPYLDQDIVSTYHPEGCLEFVYAVFNKAGLEVSETLKKSIQVPEPEDGDLIKITSSVFYGLPHWGIYYNGLVYHNWSSFRAEPYQYFKDRYALPSSPIIIYHPVLKNPGSLTSLFR